MIKMPRISKIRLWPLSLLTWLTSSLAMEKDESDDSLPPLAKRQRVEHIHPPRPELPGDLNVLLQVLFSSAEANSLNQEARPVVSHQPPDPPLPSADASLAALSPARLPRSRTVPSPYFYRLAWSYFFPCEYKKNITSFYAACDLTPYKFAAALPELKKYDSNAFSSTEEFQSFLFRFFNHVSHSAIATDLTRLLANFRKAQLYCAGYKRKLTAVQACTIFESFSHRSDLQGFSQHGLLYQAYMNFAHLNQQISDTEACTILMKLTQGESSGFNEVKIEAELLLALMHQDNRAGNLLTEEDILQRLEPLLTPATSDTLRNLIHTVVTSLKTRNQ